MSQFTSAAVAPTARAMPAGSKNRPWPVALWLFGCCAMIYVMVLLGGITRLTESGLSITDWEPIIGIIPPLSHAEWADAFARYKQIPQYEAIHAGMTLGQFKFIYFWEYLHRLWGRLIGFAFALPFLYFLLRRRLPRRLKWPLAFILFLGFCQGLLGWYMVESGLAHRIEVSQYRLTAHLSLALLIYAAILWVAVGLVRAPPQAETSAGWRRAAEGVMALVALTIAAGGFTAGLRAGYIYNTFPLMGGRLIPAEWDHLHPWFLNLFNNPAAVQFDHRVLAVTTLTLITLLWLTGWRGNLPKPAHLALHALFAAVLAQVALGISTLLLVVPVPLAVAHQGGAVALLTVAVIFRHTLRRPRAAAVMDAPAPAPI